MYVLIYAFCLTHSSLEMLAGVNMAEEGILRLLYAAVYLMCCKVGNDNDASAASRYNLVYIYHCFLVCIEDSISLRFVVTDSKL